MRIILAEHHPQARQALMALLREQPGYSVVGELNVGDNLFELLAKTPADMLLLDYEFPGFVLADLVVQVHAQDPPLKMVVMSSNPEHARIALRAGADAFVSKGDQPEWLLAGLQRFEGT